MKKQIMFVDDDPHLLAALQNVFHRDRKRWDVVFALGSSAAFEHLARTRFDVVISDMRMPGCDGVELLERVRAASPHTARVMLSGSADEAEVSRATAAVDVLLGKPCDTRTLRETIERLLGPPVPAPMV